MRIIGANCILHIGYRKPGAPLVISNNVSTGADGNLELSRAKISVVNGTLGWL